MTSSQYVTVKRRQQSVEPEHADRATDDDGGTTGLVRSEIAAAMGAGPRDWPAVADAAMMFGRSPGSRPAEVDCMRNKEPRKLRSVCFAFVALGTLCLTMSVPAFLVGLFLGPHILAPAVAVLVLGVCSLAVCPGIVRGSRVARISGVLLATIATASCSYAAVMVVVTAGEDLWTRLLVGLLWLCLGAPFAAVALYLLKVELIG